MTTPMVNDEENKPGNCLRNHRILVFLLYMLAAYVSFHILSLPESQKDVVSLLASGAILATFGSAIGSIGLIWQSDAVERIRMNVDILFRDILKEDTPWRRWPFLPRDANRKLLDGSSFRMKLTNPQIPLDVGSHKIKIDVPTALEDFFDLPLRKNCWQLLRFHSAAETLFGRKGQAASEDDTGVTPSDEYMAYTCLFDVWKTVLSFRLARYTIHLGSGLTIFGAAIVACYVALGHI